MAWSPPLSVKTQAPGVGPFGEHARSGFERIDFSDESFLYPVIFRSLLDRNGLAVRVPIPIVKILTPLSLAWSAPPGLGLVVLPVRSESRSRWTLRRHLERAKRSAVPILAPGADHSGLDAFSKMFGGEEVKVRGQKTKRFPRGDDAQRAFPRQSPRQAGRSRRTLGAFQPVGLQVSASMESEQSKRMKTVLPTAVSSP